jgi:L-threonylcarbamoyladenylate synthase
MDRFWPGPLTLVMAARRGLPAALINDAGRIGVRISSHSLAIRLVKELGHPITATSANPAGRPSARTQAEALAYFSGKIEIVLDGGTLEGTKGSTVVEIIDEEWRLIRDGAIPSAELGKALA